MNSVALEESVPTNGATRPRVRQTFITLVTSLTVLDFGRVAGFFRGLWTQEGTRFPVPRWQLLPLLLKFPGAVLPAIREAASLSEPYSKVLDQLEAEGKMRKGSWLRAWLDALAFSLSGLDCSGTTTAAMAFTVDELHWEGTRGLAYPKGGMGSVIDALAAAVRREGGEIRTNVRVEEVLVEDRCAVGVRCAGATGEVRAHEAVVCNASVWDAANLLPKEDALEEMREDWKATPQTRSYLHLHLGLDATGLDLEKLEPHYTAMTSWDDVTAEQNMTAAASCRGFGHMSQAVVIRNTFLEVGDQEHERSECFRRQVSEPVKIFSSSPKHGDGEDSDEDFAAAKTGGLRAVGASNSALL
ncbi:CRTISO [Symbiodinium sp. CCMP2592]|nr:CRTISO [Symbiodinium sp. CCMP2592]